jgi:hypothetical protein
MKIGARKGAMTECKASLSRGVFRFRDLKTALTVSEARADRVEASRGREKLQSSDDDAPRER